MTKLHNPLTDRLFKAILNLETIDDCYAFFEDICTIKEITDISQRLDVAVMLKQGKSYQEVSKATGASTATISRVNKCLNYGSGGYEIALSKLFEEDK